MTRRYLSGVSICLTSLMAGTAMAQLPAETSAPAPQEKQASTGDASEIVVTALKRANSVQDIAASVDVVGQQKLAASGIATIEELKTIVPSLIIERAPNNTISATVRGLGSAAGPVSFDQSVSLFVDGVYAPRGAEFLSAMFDIEKVEVVKGTQAAVLGKNTSLGGVLLTTRKPGDVFAADFLARYEFENNSKVMSGGVDLPITDGLALRLATQFQDLGGSMLNRFDGRHARTTDSQAFRATLGWEPSDSIKTTLSYQYEMSKNIGVNAELIRAVGPAYPTLYTLAGAPGLFEVNRDRRYASSKAGGPTSTRQPTHRANMTIDWDLGGDYSLTAVSGWSKFKQNRHIDRDYVVGDYFNEQVQVKGKQFSQELRLVSPSADRLNFILGGLFVDNSIDQVLLNTTNYPAGITGPVAVTGAYRGMFSQDTTTFSTFGQANFRLTEQLTLAGGLRYTHEKKKAAVQRTVVTPGLYSLVIDPAFPLTHLRRAENVIDGSVGIEFRPTDRVLLYASWGQGTKGGGFSDTTLPADAEFRKEVAQTYEAGVKLEAGDRSWRLNVSAFNTDVNDYQNNQFNGQRFIIQNLDLRSRGVEVQAYARPIDGLTFNLNGTYAKARNLDQVPGVGDEVPRAPRLSGQFEVGYETALTGGLNLWLNGDVMHRSSITHQTNPNAVPRGDAFTTYNGRIAVGPENGRWQMALIGRNLTNAYSLAFAFPGSFVPAGNAGGMPEESRTVALQFAFKY